MSVVIVSLLAFVLGFVGSVPLAGPISILVVARGVERDFRGALHIGLGGAVAEAIYAFLSFGAFATFLAANPVVLPIAHGITAAVLFVVGARFVFWKAPEGPARDKRKQGSSPFFVGLSVAGLNPTTFVTWSVVVTAIYARQIVPMRSWMAVPFGVAAGAGIAVWYVVLVALLKRYQGKIARRALTWVVRGMGLLLIGISVWSAIALGLYLTGHRSTIGGAHAARSPAGCCTAGATQLSLIVAPCAA